MGEPRRRIPRVPVIWLASIAAGVSVAILTWTALAPGRASRSARLSPAPPDPYSRQAVESEWSPAATVALVSDPEGIAAVSGALTPSVHDPEVLLTQSQREALTGTLALQLCARSDPEPDAYIALVDSLPGVRWIGPDDGEAWHSIEGALRDVHPGFVPDRNKPREALRAFIEGVNEQQGARPLAAGAGPRGARIHVYRVTNEEEMLDEHSRRIPDSEENGYWLAGHYGVGALRFHLPRRTLTEVLRAEGSALVAATFVLVQTESGETYNWYCYWYWDSASASWQVDTMARKGRLGMLYL